jgi:zinc protease
MFGFLVNLTMCLALAGCAGKATKSPETAGQAPGGVPLVGTFKVHPFTLDNGLRLLVVEDHSSPTLAYQTWFRVGSRDEVMNYTGLAHLFEHMMFKGTKAHPEGQYEHILEEAGAEGLNAFTSQDYTAYIQEIPSDKLDLLASLESDRMHNLVVNDQSFRTEVGVVQNERRFRNENNPDGMIEQELFGLAFKKHPYHWPVVGYQEDLDRMSSENAREFYQNYYNPSHATIVMVGDVTPDRALSVVKKYYGSLPGKASPPHVVEAEPAAKETRRKTLNMNIQVQKLWVAYRVPSITNPDAPKLEVLASILTGGKSSRLHRALVETGIASSVEASNPGSEDPSLFTIVVNLQKGKKAAQAEAVINREIQRLFREPISDREMERAQNRLSFDFYSGLSTSYEKARFLGYFEASANDFQKGIEFRKEIPKVTPADVQSVVKTYFVPDNRTVITALPKTVAKTK